MHADTFPSRVDAWLVVVVAGGIVAALAGAVAALESSPAESLLGFGGTAFMLLVIVLVGVPCEYTLADDHLLIRSGIVRQRIHYADITDVAPSRSLWAAPAMSLRRVKVSFGGRFQLVSPRDRERFIAELRARVGQARPGA